jgi:hypothetical protein
MLPRIEVQTLSLTEASRRLNAVAREVDSLSASFVGRTSGALGAAGSADVDAALSELRAAWGRALGQLAQSMNGFGRNTATAAVVYEAADRLPAPTPPAAPKEPACKPPALPFMPNPCDNLA